MKKKHHILLILILIIGLVIEILPIGLISAISGAVILVISTTYAYNLAKHQYVKSFVAIVLIQILAIYVFAKPNQHYSTNQYVNGKFEGNPHNHPIWENDHIH